MAAIGSVEISKPRRCSPNHSKKDSAVAHIYRNDDGRKTILFVERPRMTHLSRPWGRAKRCLGKSWYGRGSRVVLVLYHVDISIELLFNY